MKTNKIEQIASVGLGALLLWCSIECVNAQPTIITNIAVPTGSLSALDPTLNRIYISEGGNSTPQTLVIDGNTFTNITVVAGWGSSVDLDNNNLWTADVYSGSTIAYSGTTDAAVASVSLGDCPITVAVDSPNRRVWVIAQCGGGNDPVTAINADTYAIICGPNGTGGVIGGPITANPVTGRFYFSSGGVTKVANPSNNCAISTASFGGVMSVNVEENLLYGQSSSTTIQIINGTPSPEVVLTNITVPFSYNGTIGVNPNLNRLYIGNNSSSNIAVLNSTTGQSVESINLPGGITSVEAVLADATRDLIYATVVSNGNNYLYVIQDTPLLGINMYAGVTIYAPAGSTNKIQYVNNLSSTNWITLTNLVLPTDPYIFIDYSSAGQPQRFYRDVQ